MGEKEFIKPQTGPPSLEELRGEPFTSFRFMLPKRHHEYLKSKSIQKRVTVAEYLRRLIEADMIQVDPRTTAALTEPPPTPPIDQGKGREDELPF